MHREHIEIRKVMEMTSNFVLFNPIVYSAQAKLAQMRNVNPTMISVLITLMYAVSIVHTPIKTNAKAIALILDICCLQKAHKSRATKNGGVPASNVPTHAVGADLAPKAAKKKNGTPPSNIKSKSLIRTLLIALNRTGIKGDRIKIGVRKRINATSAGARGECPIALMLRAKLDHIKRTKVITKYPFTNGEINGCLATFSLPCPAFSIEKLLPIHKNKLLFLLLSAFNWQCLL